MGKSKTEYSQPSREVSVITGPGIQDLLLLLLEPSLSNPKGLHNPRKFVFSFNDRSEVRTMSCLINGLPWGLSHREEGTVGIILTEALGRRLEKGKIEITKFKGRYNFHTRKGRGRLVFEKLSIDD